jgi:FKBP-type peptidyl-prolyl cis-trans isomerase
MMKRLICVFVMASAVLFVCAAGGKSDQAGKNGGPAANAGASPDNAAMNISYAFGVYLGSNPGIEETGVSVDYDVVAKGFRDALGKTPGISLEDAVALINTAITEVRQKKAAENKQKEIEFLARNGKRAEVQTTASGLQYEILVQGNGAKPRSSDTVEVYYEGTYLDGTLFSRTDEEQKTSQIPLNRVFPGWSEGMQLMNTGSTYTFYIPSALAYGENGREDARVPPNATLIITVELKSIVK